MTMGVQIIHIPIIYNRK